CLIEGSSTRQRCVALPAGAKCLVRSPDVRISKRCRTAAACETHAARRCCLRRRTLRRDARRIREVRRETNHSMGEKCWTYEDDKAEERAGRSFRNPISPGTTTILPNASIWTSLRRLALEECRQGVAPAFRGGARVVARAGTTTAFW